jgi:hypothetical protein
MIRVIIAALVAVAGSLVVCRLLVLAAVTLSPSLSAYAHFAFADYAKLTIIGVLVSCLAWPLVTLVTSQGRQLLLYLALIVTLASFIPDAWVLYQGQPAAAVGFLALMHIGLLCVTYPALILIAPQPNRRMASHLPVTSDE